MAPTALRFITRSSQLCRGAFPSRTISTYTTRNTCDSIQTVIGTHRKTSINVHSQHGSLLGGCHYSTSSIRHTPQPAEPLPTRSTRSILNCPNNIAKTSTPSILHQTRFISNQPSNDNAPKTSGPLSTPTPKIAAPSILKKALASASDPHENIYTIPNILTFSRLLCAPAIGYFILSAQPVTALALFAYAGFTDLIDGFLARRFNQQTVVGTVIDPMADKTLMTIAVVCLGLQGQIPLWLAAIILGRDVGLAISAIYYRWISLPPPKTLARYWDFSLPSAEVRPTEISKINTLLQLLLVGNAMVLPVLPAAWIEAWNLVGVFEGWQFLVAATTVWSGLSYVFSKDAVKILSQQEGQSKATDGPGDDGKKL